jgi:anthranilate synthase component 1
MVARAKEYIRAGDIFQVVLGQRFERKSKADPFDVYRALRAVNPSPYMVYMQCAGVHPRREPGDPVPSEARRRVALRRRAVIVTNRPLAGTRKRGARRPTKMPPSSANCSPTRRSAPSTSCWWTWDATTSARGAEPGSVRLDRDHGDRALQPRDAHQLDGDGRPPRGARLLGRAAAALPVGTISGAPKIRAMQIIDELEPIGAGPTAAAWATSGSTGRWTSRSRCGRWSCRTAMPKGRVGVSPAGRRVASSRTQAGRPEYMETVNKAAALARAIDVAERAFGLVPPSHYTPSPA